MSIIHYDYAEIESHLGEVRKQAEIIAASSNSILKHGNSIEWHDASSAENFKATVAKLNKSLEQVKNDLGELSKSAQQASHSMQDANERIAKSWA